MEFSGIGIRLSRNVDRVSELVQIEGSHLSFIGLVVATVAESDHARFRSVLEGESQVF